MTRPPPTPEPASRPPVRLSVTVPPELYALIRRRAAHLHSSHAEVVLAALWRSFGMREPAKKRGAR